MTEKQQQTRRASVPPHRSKPLRETRLEKVTAQMERTQIADYVAAPEPAFLARLAKFAWRLIARRRNCFRLYAIRVTLHTLFSTAARGPQFADYRRFYRRYRPNRSASAGRQDVLKFRIMDQALLSMPGSLLQQGFAFRHAAIILCHTRHYGRCSGDCR